VGSLYIRNIGEQHLKRYLKHSPKKVALLCMGPSATDYLTKTLTQEYDPNWVDEVWCINMSANPFRCDVVFWMDDLVQQENFRPKLFVALRKFGMPVITSVARPSVVPNSFDYPIDEVAKISCPVFGKPYLNNGVAMAIAYALLIGVEDMSIYGADFSYPNRDYAESGRACVESWLTLAGIKGMNIQLAPNTSLMDSVKDHGIYGYAEQPEVDIGNGRKFKYVKSSEMRNGKYVPEDSSGVKNEVRNANAGSGGGAPVDQRSAAGPDQTTRIEAAPVTGPGPGVRSGHPGFSDDQRQALAVHDSGGRGGSVPGTADLPVPPPARPDQPRL
jgi:hypothetical protein